MLTRDDQRRLKRVVRKTAAYRLANLVDTGWPYEMVDGKDPPESEEELEYMLQAMRGIIREVLR